MGLDNRDYIRQSQQPGMFGGGGGAPFPPVIKALLAINIGVFLLQFFTTENNGTYSPVTGALWLSLDSVMSGQVWRLVTSAFCHSVADIFHIVLNMLFLVMFGRELERRYGSREFLAFYLVAVVVASIAYIGVDAITGDITPAVGASGAVMAVLVLFACLHPRQEVYLFFVIKLEIRYLVAIILFMDLTPAIAALMGKNFETGVAHWAHLGGMLFGYLYYKMNLRLAKLIPGGAGAKSQKPKRKKADLSTSGRSKTEIDAQMDALLQKISDKGFQSLTEKEKKFMEQASDKYRK